MKKFTLFFSALLFSMMSFAGVVTFDADADKGNAGTDSNNAAAYTITKGGVTVEVSSGILGTYNNEMHYRIYKNQTLKITSTAGNITSVEFTCTANGDTKYGPGCFTVDGGDYTYAEAVGTWTGSATEITFTAATNQVRASQIVVTIDGEVGETPEQPETPEEPETPVTPENPEGVITCAEAVAICEATGETATTETYTIRGYVTEIKEAYTDQYKNVSCWMADEKGGGQVFLAFRVKPINAADQAVKVNDYIEVKGALVNYYGNTPETTAGGSMTIITAGEGGETPEEPETPVTPENPEGVITCAEAVAICEATGETATTETYTIRGYVTEIKEAYTDQYKNVSCWMADEKGGGQVFLAFRVKPINAADQAVKVNDYIEVKGALVNYYGNTPETTAGGSMTIITAGEGGETPEEPETPVTPETPEGAIVFDADVDQGNAGTDSNNAAAYEVEKNGVTMTVSSGILGTFNNEVHYRIYKNQTLTLTSTVGNIVKVEFTCTADGDTKYGPGGFTVTEGEYGHTGGAVGTWTGSASEIVFSASVNQVRASQVVVTIEGGATPDTDVVNVTDMQYADAYYMEEDGVAYWDIQMYNVDEATEEIVVPIVLLGVEAKSKTALNGTYDMFDAFYGDSIDVDTYDLFGIAMDAETVGTLTIKNVNEEGDYSFVGSFVGEDGKTYKINTVANVYAEDDATEEVIELKEEGTDEPGDDPVTPPTPPTTDGAVTFDADVDQGNAGTDSNNAAAYTITKSGVTMEVSSGILGTYNNEMHYRVYKNQTLTLTSTVGKIVKVEFTCTANDAEKYGPGCFTVDGGDYTYAGPVGTWTGSADAIVFTASSNQVRATQVVVTLASTGTGVEDVVTVEVPVKVIENGQLMIIRGENVYNVLGAQVK